MPLYRNPYVHVLRTPQGARAFNTVTLELFELDDEDVAALESDPSSFGPDDGQALLDAGLLRTAPAEVYEAAAMRNADRQAVSHSRNGVFTSMRLSLTEKCNLACDYCFQQKMFADAQPEMDDDLLDQTMNWFISQGRGMPLTVQYFGGEPLMKWDLMARADAMLAAAKADGTISGYRQTITTNGTLLTASRAKWLVEKSFDVTVSIDGPPEVNDRHRVNKAGRGTYDSAVRGLRNLEGAGGDCAILMTATADNVQLLPEYVRYFVEESDLPVQTIGLNSPQPTTSGWETGGQVLAESVYEVWRYCEARGIGFHGPGTYIPEHLQTRRAQTDGCIDLTRNELDTAGWPVYVAADGSKSLCLVIHKDERVSTGVSLGMPRFRAGGAAATELRHGAREDVSPERAKAWHHAAEVKTDCDKCIAVSICGGPCAVERILWGDKLNQDRCGFIQTMTALVLTDA